ncbi:hypothetical protein J14TS2_00610 [Bacillus sp. J14TS2]|uniref:CehA/McbA family metallohydrolase n=1 Tax=Bacillus sp. J14TS2 TaxID=2807188 RepID=UPI001B2CCEDB|nr:CehA/McbA family metallohydrolase [Bacillus sp. J14TS2]GIN69586.1 hypothetical protein J14TS2_00610 [Bacillus sp. J14TS2]
MNNHPNAKWKETFIRQIAQEEQEQYIEVKFSVPENIESIHVKMEVTSENPSETVIDLGVRDSNRVRGWSGGARAHFYISETSATPGYLQGTLQKGEWAVLLGSYKVQPNGCEVKLEIEYTPKIYRWLRGDLHLHSVHSDGTYTLKESIEIAESLQLDFIALTDHNTSSQNYARPRDAKITIIPGMELTTNKGHLNLLGVEDPLQDFRVNSDLELAQRLKEARKNGAAITLNHPYCRYTGWKWDWNFDYDFVEIWNGPWREDNQKALNWWQQELSNGRKLVAIGGSDTHRPDPFVKHGGPTTWVYSKSKSQEDILNEVHQGHVHISYSPTGPLIEMECGNSMMGDTCVKSNETIDVKASRIKNKDIIKIYTNKGLELEKIITNDEQVELKINNDNRTFYRGEIWRYFSEVDEYLLAALCNPIYFD